ncbi:hypothetical protein J010_03486 [Cryptococcus neoformans]|nr:hypothetical protein J010_03486 [Cryptococcus neoformans var. grubii]
MMSDWYPHSFNKGREREKEGRRQEEEEEDHVRRH